MFGCLALVALVLFKNVGDEDLLEFADRFVIEDSRCVHFRDKDCQFVLHLGLPFYQLPVMRISGYSALF